MEKILELARQLGERIADNPVGAKYLDASKLLDQDTEAKKIIQEYENTAQNLAQKEKQNQPIEPEEKHQLNDLQAKLASNDTIKNWMQAQVEYVNLLRQVNDNVMKQMAVKPRQTEQSS